MAEVIIVRECKYGQVRVCFGNVTRVEGDIMVIPANNRLAGREGLDEVMQLAAGPELRAACTEIAKEKRSLDIELIKNQVNELIFFAENLGEIPPNTTAINIQYEGYNKTHIMRSNMDKSASINFYIEEE